MALIGIFAIYRKVSSAPSLSMDIHRIPWQFYAATALVSTMSQCNSATIDDDDDDPHDNNDDDEDDDDNVFCLLATYNFARGISEKKSGPGPVTAKKTSPSQFQVHIEPSPRPQINVGRQNEVGPRTAEMGALFCTSKVFPNPTLIRGQGVSGKRQVQ